MYVELNEENEITYTVKPGGAYRNIVSFGQAAKDYEYFAHGLYKFINEPQPEITNTQYYGEQIVTIDDIAKTYTRSWTVIDMTPEEVLTVETRLWKKERAILVENIEVVYNTIIFQGDETSQDRMSRTINALPDDITTIPWTAKDNSIHHLNKSDLKAILFDAGSQQSAIWNTGRPTLGT